jgi:predicted acylesterase/phospholipase RssA
MKRILALDGGGIRGVFTLEVLLKMENLLREQQYNNSPDFVLRDHFDLFAGTSTGAIIAALLCWGKPVSEILDLYTKHGREMFHPAPWRRPIRKIFYSRFSSKPLTNRLQILFSEKGTHAELGANRLRRMDIHNEQEGGSEMETLAEGEGKFLLLVVRNHSTGSSWPLTNNPHAKFNLPTRPETMLRFPLWQLVRASTAAPTYFDPEEIVLGGMRQLLVDGSISPYSNPALIAALTAILPAYKINWPTGPEKIRVVSVGTIEFSSRLQIRNQKLWLGHNARKIPVALLQTIAWQQDYLCRCLGECLYGELLDTEVGHLVESMDGASNGEYPVWKQRPGPAWFSYVRYNPTYRREGDLDKMLKKYPRLSEISAVDTIPILHDIGREYAEQTVKLEHLV